MDNIYTSEFLTKLSTIITENDISQDTEGKYNEEAIKYIEVETTDWEINYKDYASKSTVFYFPELNVYIEVDENRSGSYYSDYYYDDPVFRFVEPKTETIVRTVYTGVEMS